MKKNDKDNNPEIQDETIVVLEQKIGELTSGWQRTQADFQNYRRQTEEDRKKLIKMANVELLTDILPVLDNFQLAAKHMPLELEGNNWVIGIKQIEKQLESILADSGLEKIPALGLQFDPNFHESIESIASDRPENEVVDEISSGYKFGDTIIRPTKVRISSGK
ncbi:MAG: nucleotide exchange factor GrpE [bacterium]